MLLEEAHLEALGHEDRHASGHPCCEAEEGVHGPAAGLHPVAPPVDQLGVHADGPGEGGPREAADLVQPFEALGEVLRQPVGLMEDDVLRESLALFLTASVRGRNAPPMAFALVGSGLLPSQVENRISELEGALRDASSGTIGGLGQIAMRSWHGIGFTSGRQPWQRAAQHFARLLTPFKDQHASEEAIRHLLEVVERNQTEALIDIDYSQSRQGQVNDLPSDEKPGGRHGDTCVSP